MSKDVKKLIRIPEELTVFVSVLAKSLNISENDAYKMIVFDYFRNSRESLFKVSNI